jgi:hypothetical protein
MIDLTEFEVLMLVGFAFFVLAAFFGSMNVPFGRKRVRFGFFELGLAAVTLAFLVKRR